MNKEITVYDYYMLWVKVHKKGKVVPVTLNKYLIIAKRLRFYFGNTKIKDLTRSKMQEFFNYLGGKYEKNTVYDYKHSLKKSMDDAVYEGYVEKNPMHNIELTFLYPRKRKRKFLNLNELKALLSHLNINELGFGAGIYLTAKSGLRFAELLGLTPKDINFEEGYIEVNKSFNYKKRYFSEARKNVILGEGDITFSELRQLKGYDTIHRLALAIDVSPNYLRCFEIGSKWMSMTKIREMAKVLGVSVNDLSKVRRVPSYGLATGEEEFYEGEFKPPKNKQSFRKIYIDDQTIDMLKNITTGLDPKKSIFSKVGDVDSVSTNWVWNKELGILCERANVTPISMHGLRHTYASVLVVSGIPTISISKQLGHSSTRITEEVYIHLLDEQRQKNVSEIRGTLGLIG